MSMDTHFDAVIVGTGFGGSVMAYRLAEAGLRVCVLERGKAYPPGSFPRTPSGFAKNFWDPSEGLYGMYDVWSFSGLESLVSSGLGGGSLIYANVLLRKDEKWFVDDDPEGNYPGGYRKWPVDRATLEEHYDRVEKMMGAMAYPFAEAPYRDTPKTQAMLDAAVALGRPRDWLLPRLAVSFAATPEGTPAPGLLVDDGSRNLHGRARVTCQLCGECDAGCNYGAKNTLDYNYLSRAVDHGADIRTLAEVKRIAPRQGGGYAVTYVRHDTSRASDEGQREMITLTCDRLVLAAGTYGSTYLLLKNRATLPNLSAALGSRFCGNGDLLTFAFDCRTRDGAPRAMEPSYGPVITSALRVGDTLDDDATGRGFYIEDAGVPAFMTMLLQLTDTSDAAARGLRFAWHQLQRKLHVGGKSELGGELSSLLGPGSRSSTSLPLLGMGRDVPNGRMSLDDEGWLENDWTTEASWPYFTRVREVMKQMAQSWGAEHFQDDPLWYLKRVVTVHPLGGCPMGTSRDEGVVDPFGEVFGHDDLYVADGSVLPGPVGANPSLTIGAVADRFADRIIDRARRGVRAAATDVPASAPTGSVSLPT
jgi:cholesterol oxidase